MDNTEYIINHVPSGFLLPELEIRWHANGVYEVETINSFYRKPYEVSRLFMEQLDTIESSLLYADAHRSVGNHSGEHAGYISEDLKTIQDFKRILKNFWGTGKEMIEDRILNDKKLGRHDGV